MYQRCFTSDTKFTQISGTSGQEDRDQHVPAGDCYYPSFRRTRSFAHPSRER